jgi:type IX secretion system PorP/SprF family membrane protein
MKKAEFILFLFLGIVPGAYAQDLQFTQFYANPLYLNPAFAGSNYCPRICVNYRNQWPNLSGTYVSYSASYDRYVEALSGGLGILVTSDNQARGTLKTTTASLMYSYSMSVTRSFSIKAALQATYFQKSIDRSKLNFGDMIDARRGFVWNTNEVVPAQSKQNADFSAGVLGYSRHYFFGVAAGHITQPDEGLIGPSRLPLKLTVHGGAIIELEKGSESSISPNILFQQQQNFTQLNLGIYFVKEHFVAGLWYRNSDAFIVLLGIQYAHLKLGYSYDVTVSKLSSNTAGSHEISLQLQFECKKRRPRYRLLDCPSF